MLDQCEVEGRAKIGGSNLIISGPIVGEAAAEGLL